MPKKIITWVEGLKGVSGVVIFFNHLRSCLWPESSHAVADAEHQYIIAYPYISLLFGGNLAVRLYFVMSGFSLVYRPLQMMEDGQGSVLYQRVSVQLQSRFYRLWIPSAVAAFIALLLAQAGAFEHGRHVCAAFDKVTPVSEGIAADLWLYLKDTVIDMWVIGTHHFHDSLWCMKILLVGSYLMYILVIMRVSSRHGVWLWWLIGSCLLSPTVASLNYGRGATDLAGFVFGGVIAYTIINLDAKEDGKATESKWTFVSPTSILWTVGLIGSLGLGSYPHGRAERYYFEPMYAIGRFYLGIDSPRHVMIWWHNIAAFLICLCICHLPSVQYVLGLPWLQWLGKISFAFFLLHPLVLRSVGAYLLTTFNRLPDVPLDLVSSSDLPAVLTVVVALPLALLVSHFWSIYVEGKLHVLVEKHLIIKKPPVANSG